MRFWPITASPMTAMSAVGSMFNSQLELARYRSPGRFRQQFFGSCSRSLSQISSFRYLRTSQTPPTPNPPLSAVHRDPKLICNGLFNPRGPVVEVGTLPGRGLLCLVVDLDRMKTLLVQDACRDTTLKAGLSKWTTTLKLCANREQAQEELARDHYPFLVLDLQAWTEQNELCRWLRRHPDPYGRFVLASVAEADLPSAASWVGR